MTVRALFSMGVNVLGGIYVQLLPTTISLRVNINHCMVDDGD